LKLYKPASNSNMLRLFDGAIDLYGELDINCVYAGNTKHTLRFSTNNASYQGKIEFMPNVKSMSFFVDGTSDYRLSLGNTIAQFRCDVLPQADDTYDLGSTSYKYAEVHATNLYGDGSNLTNLPTTSRTTANAATSSIANNASGNISITAAKTYALLKVQTSAAAWVTLYTDSTSRSNDASRAETTDPLPGSGVIAEVITSGAATQVMTPGVIGWNDDGTPASTVYAKVVNKSGSTQAITVTLHYLPLET
jgi:hypothetical protein